MTNEEKIFMSRMDVVLANIKARNMSANDTKNPYTYGYVTDAEWRASLQQTLVRLVRLYTRRPAQRATFDVYLNLETRRWTLRALNHPAEELWAEYEELCLARELSDGAVDIEEDAEDDDS